MGQNMMSPTLIAPLQVGMVNILKASHCGEGALRPTISAVLDYASLRDSEDRDPFPPHTMAT